MTYTIINDAGQYKLAKLLESKKNYYQVTVLPEQISKKIKLAQKIYEVVTNNPDTFLQDIECEIATIDTHLLWELLESSDERIKIEALSQIYFGNDCTHLKQTALLIALSRQYVHFIDYNDGSFKKCSPLEQDKRQAILDKEQQKQQLYDSYYKAFINLTLPETPLDGKEILRLINKPDKGSIIYKVLLKVSKELNLTPLEIFHKIGIVPDLERFFVDSFILETFPNGINYKYDKDPNKIKPCIDVNRGLKVFSIDDVNTTEIDDAFSVTYLDSGFIIGIHISAPALDQNLQDMVADNISTIYYPGHKFTMLPPEIIDAYSLWEGKTLPVTSIYFKLDSEFSIIEYYSHLETVTIEKNLRIEELEHLFSPEDNDCNNSYPFKPELSTLYKFACNLEQIRGKPSVSSVSKDFNFTFLEDKIVVKPRLRGNPIDKLVSELMILANCSWGRMLTNAFIPAIYRVKQPNFPVKMTLSADSHTGLNVSYYTWATSPLRRSADYINQRQIISLITQQKSHYTNLDHTLLQVVEDFDKKYAQYIDFQIKMERFWSLNFLLQEQISEVTATFIFRSKVQLNNVPIELDVSGTTTVRPRGTQVKLKIFNINLTKLSFDFKIMSDVVNSSGEQE